MIIKKFNIEINMKNYPCMSAALAYIPNLKTAVGGTKTEIRILSQNPDGWYIIKVTHDDSEITRQQIEDILTTY